MMFVHLTTHSAYSLQEGLLTPSELVQAATANGMPAIGLTDHRLLTGTIEFVTACRDVGLQPIIGLEIDLASGPLHLLATNLAGWSNVCRLSSALTLMDQPDGPCSLHTLAEYSDGLIALSNQPQPLIDIFNGRLYVSLNNPARAASFSKMANQLGLPTVVTHPVYYLDPKQSSLQRTLTAIRLNQTVGRLSQEFIAPPDSHFIGQQEMEERFKDYPEALVATLEIAERCKFELPIGVPNMPVVRLPAGLTPAEHLRNKAIEGAKHLYGEITSSIQSRLDHELEVISNMGYEPIFLIVEDILNFARETGVPFSSRGSAASSLVAHCLGITS
ncbi:MAG TPA: PHP domain-containing protein, partial [Anaerolineales bacterium]|nr:PHP domain-containing protein [Anaerolineales bacterium]